MATLYFKVLWVVIKTRKVHNLITDHLPLAYAGKGLEDFLHPPCAYEGPSQSSQRLQTCGFNFTCYENLVLQHLRSLVGDHLDPQQFAVCIPYHWQWWQSCHHCQWCHHLYASQSKHTPVEDTKHLEDHVLWLVQYFWHHSGTKVGSEALCDAGESQPPDMDIGLPHWHTPVCQTARLFVKMWTATGA